MVGPPIVNDLSLSIKRDIRNPFALTGENTEVFWRHTLRRRFVVRDQGSAAAIKGYSVNAAEATRKTMLDTSASLT